MTTIVWGHGSRGRGEEKTFVPDGTTVKWYADLDQNLLTRNGFLALSSGDFGAPNDSQGPGKGTDVLVYNYVVSEDLAKRDKVAILHRGSSALQFVGAEVAQGPLCPTPVVCRTAGVHSCSGLLGTVKDSEIVILVCRGLPGGNAGTEAFGSDDVTSDIGKEFKEWFDQWVKRVLADPDGAMGDFETYSDPVKLQVGTYLAVPAWQAVHWGSKYAAASQFDDAFTQFRDLPDASSTRYFLDNVAQYRSAFAGAAATDPQAFFAALDRSPQPVRDVFNGVSDIAVERERATQTTAQAGFEEFAATSWVPDAADLAQINGINQAAVKSAEDGESLDYVVAGFALLIGSGHGAAYDTWAANEPDQARGTITVKRATFGAGKLEVEGCPPAKQSIVEAALNSFSDKDVKFV
jgi:putative adhesin Stv-like protein